MLAKKLILPVLIVAGPDAEFVDPEVELLGSVLDALGLGACVDDVTMPRLIVGSCVSPSVSQSLLSRLTAAIFAVILSTSCLCKSPCSPFSNSALES